MIRRFAYHGFWNFYDYLGTLTLFGTVYALLFFGVLVLAAFLGSGSDGTSGLLLVGGIELVVTTLLLSAVMGYCARAARGEPARWPALMPSLKRNWAGVGKVLLVWAVVTGIIAVNLQFYSKLQSQLEASPWRIVMLGVTSVVGWLGFLLQVFLPPWLAAASAGNDKSSLRESARAALVAFALTPALWMAVFAVLVLVIVSGFYTRITFIFVLPVLASFAQTAYHLSVQYVGFIGSAREELGVDLPLRRYKSRATEMAWDWEFRQPRRTFKELVKPWEY